MENKNEPLIYLENFKEFLMKIKESIKSFFYLWKKEKKVDSFQIKAHDEFLNMPLISILNDAP
jgi:hypothetical protein